MRESPLNGAERVGGGEQEKCLLPRITKAANLEFHVGWPGWARPPTMGGGGGQGESWSAKGRRVF